MIKFGWRYNLLYPGLFILTLGIRTIVNYIRSRVFNGKTSYINMFLIYLIQIIGSLIIIIVQKKINLRQNLNFWEYQYLKIHRY